MDLGLVSKLIHVLSAMWFISGVVGRGVTFAQAARATQISTAHTLLKLSDFFERRMVLPGSMAVLGFGLLVAWLRGWPLWGFLQGANSNWLLTSLIFFLAPTPMIPLYLIPRRRQRAKLAEEALARGAVTAELTAALHDQGVMTYRMVELIVAVVVTILMVTKPF